MVGTRAHIVGAFEHPERRLPNTTLPNLLTEIAYGALADAGLNPKDVDALFTSSESPGFGALSLAEHLGLGNLRYIDNTEAGGATYPMQVARAARAIENGDCSVALILMGGVRSRIAQFSVPPEAAFEDSMGATVAAYYALAAQRHMYEFGTTNAQLAAVRVAASMHAQHNPLAAMRSLVTVEEVLESPLISDPLHRLDCCLVTDGGGAIVLAREEVARSLRKPSATVRGSGAAVRNQFSLLDMTSTAAAISAPRAYESAGLTADDIDYASVYDSFTITVIMSLEDLGFCQKGEGGAFVADGQIIAGTGRIPVNTDGGGLSNNHPDFRGGMIRTIEAVRQLRGEANPPVQVPDCELALVQAHGGLISTRAVSSTVILERHDW